MKKTITIFFTVLLSITSAIGAEEKQVDENELFSNTDTVLDNKKYEKKDVDEDQNKKRIGISGEITSVNPYAMSRDYVKKRDHKDNKFDPYINGVLHGDIRLPSNVKGFGSFELNYNAVEETTLYKMRELFIDFNIANAVYFRTGKQVLQWGRCYLWNPTDLINTEKKSFEQKIGAREGTYGLKAHVPFGTKANMYGFADTSNADDVDKIAGAYKLEFLISRTEMAFSVWGKKENHPVYGYDFSTRFGWIDIVGEASASYGSNMDRVVERMGVLTTERENGRWIPKASVDFGNAFDVGDQKDKVQLNLEFYYNGDGYSKNFLTDESIYRYDKPVNLESGGKSTSLPGGIKAYYLLGKNLYEPNYHSRYYAALFSTINKFFRSELSLTLNLIANIEHLSFILMTGLNYADINDFKAGITVYSYLGKDNTEYTFHKRAANILLTAGIIF